MTELDRRTRSIIGSTSLEGGELDEATGTDIERIVAGELDADDAIAAIERHRITTR